MAASESGAPPTFDKELLGNLLDGTLMAALQAAGETLATERAALETTMATSRELAEAIETGDRQQLVLALKELADDDGTDEDTILALDTLKRKAQPQHEHFPLLLAAVRAGVPALLHGEASSGKSEAAKQAAKILKLPFRPLSLNPNTTDTKFFGFIDAAGNYHSTGLREIFENGGVFLFDELDNAHPASASAVNYALSNGGATFPDATIDVHPQARFVAAANTVGRGPTADYVGRSPIDAATRDRFAFIPWDIDPELEKALVLGDHIPDNKIDIGKGGIPEVPEWLDVVVEYREAFHAIGIKQLCSMRSSLYGRRLANAGVGMDWLKEMCIYRGMKPQDREKVDKKVRG